MINAAINVPRILQAMEVKQLKKVDVCRLCGVNNKTLATILRGEIPHRIDPLYRILKGLQLSAQEVIIAAAHKKAEGSRLRVVSNRR